MLQAIEITNSQLGNDIFYVNFTKQWNAEQGAYLRIGIMQDESNFSCMPVTKKGALERLNGSPLIDQLLLEHKTWHISQEP